MIINMIISKNNNQFYINNNNCNFYNYNKNK